MGDPRCPGRLNHRPSPRVAHKDGLLQGGHRDADVCEGRRSPESGENQKNRFFTRLRGKRRVLPAGGGAGHACPLRRMSPGDG